MWLVSGKQSCLHCIELFLLITESTITVAAEVLKREYTKSCDIWSIGESIATLLAVAWSASHAVV